MAARWDARCFLGLLGVPPARTRFGRYRLLPVERPVGPVGDRAGRERRAGMRFWFMGAIVSENFMPQRLLNLPAAALIK